VEVETVDILCSLAPLDTLTIRGLLLVAPVTPILINLQSPVILVVMFIANILKNKNREGGQFLPPGFKIKSSYWITIDLQ
jgi:hypothetical protein